MKFKIDLFRILLLLVITALPVGCASSSKSNILIGADDCKPPCWIKIHPGITKKEDMIARLTELEERKDGKLTLLENGIAWWQSANGNNSYFYSPDGDLVTKIEVDLRSTSIYLDDVTVIFGAPSKLDIGKISDGYFFATIFYPERGLAFVVGGNKFDGSSATKNFPIDPDMVVVKGVFFQPLDVESMVNLLYGVDAIPQALSDIQDWTGYGVYRE